MTLDLTCRSCGGSGHEWGTSEPWFNGWGGGTGSKSYVLCPTCDGAGQLDRHQVALDIARAHGTGVAHEVTGLSKGVIVRLRKQHDGYDRGRGRPSRAEMDAEAPRIDCECVRCIDWRTSLHAALTHAHTAQRPFMVALAGLADPWRADRACRDADPDVFFPGRGESHAEAQQICSTCPVRAQCLEYALSNGEKHGVWGGLSERERRRLRRARRESEAA